MKTVAQYRGRAIGPRLRDVSDAPILEAQVLEALRLAVGAADPGFVPDMASLFLSETETILKDIRKALDASDFETVTRLAHGLKSSSATLGLMRISAAARQLEVDGRGGDAARMASGRAELEAAFSASRPTIEGLAQPSSS